MSAEFGSPYELLGVKPGASIAELKAAYRDMAKVWHPDRFAHDERLQKKAQEKLKEINEAYEQLLSGKTPRPQPSAHDFSTRRSQRTHVGTSLLLIVVGVMIFGVTFFVTSRSLSRQQLEASSSNAESSRNLSDPATQPVAVSNQTVNDHRTNRSEAELKPEPTDTLPKETVVTPAPAMETITVLVDPGSGLLAKSDCPVKTRMTYPSGSQPKGYCTVTHPNKSQSDTDSPEARVKSIAKRVASPNKWLGSSKGKAEEEK